MPKHTLCCVITVYNGTDIEQFIQSIDSILSQSKCPDEIRIVIDGSIGVELFNIIKSYSKLSVTNIIYHKLEKNMGAGFARNEGVKKTLCDYVAIMDSDDLSRKDRFQLQYDYIINNSLDVCGGHIEEFSSDLSNTRRVRKAVIGLSNIRLSIKLKCPLNNVTVMFKRVSFLDVGGYPLKRTSEDYELWARFLVGNYNIDNIDHILADVRFNTCSLKKRNGRSIFNDDVKTQKFMYDNGLISFFEYLRNLFLYASFRFSPTSFVNYLYKRHLRE